ncbi:hypothetical protein [Paenibacillus stellifer]|uniref:hypothetical protein n=1 Tax=Paenibacillus stellifer TaxID=169760 RepID=UPI0012EE47E1|nr:hypothetical protein [Paenibacillus stellifer]
MPAIVHPGTMALAAVNLNSSRCSGVGRRYDYSGSKPLSGPPVPVTPRTPTRQKSLRAMCRFALTGTPVENSLEYPLLLACSSRSSNP